MVDEFACQFCYHSLPAYPGWGGRSIQCPNCYLLNTIPDSNAMPPVVDEPEAANEGDPLRPDPPQVEHVEALVIKPLPVSSLPLRWNSLLNLPGSGFVNYRVTRWLLGLLTYLAGFLLAVSFIRGWAALYDHFWHVEPDKQTIQCMILAFFSMMYGTHQLRKKVTARRGREILQGASGRHPILFLRAFVDDELVVDRQLDEVMGLRYERRITLEEVLVPQLEALGPVLAIGRPRQVLPPVGAGRLWLDNSAWQGGVDLLLPEAQLVVMVMGQIHGPDGLAWELQRIASFDCLEKLVLVIPPVGEDQVRHRWLTYQGILGSRMPEYVFGALLVRFLSSRRCQIVATSAERGLTAYQNKIRIADR